MGPRVERADDDATAVVRTKMPTANPLVASSTVLTLIVPPFQSKYHSRGELAAARADDEAGDNVTTNLRTTSAHARGLVQPRQ